MMKRRKSLQTTAHIKIIIIVIFIAIIVKVLDYYGSSDSLPEYPGYKREKLETIADMKSLYEGNITKEEERQLFLQTGLGEWGIEGIRKESKNMHELEKKLHYFQKQLFEEKGKKKLTDLQTGDVLVSMSQRLFFYPHGHAAIVTDGKENILLEARSYHAGSCPCKEDKWANLSSFIVLRLKKEIRETFKEQKGYDPAQKAADYAKENLDGLKYSLFKDLRPLSGSTLEYTQCAHLVWYAYYVSGLDIDENRGIIIKPKDFLESDVFEIVQVFGISPDKLLRMRDE